MRFLHNILTLSYTCSKINFNIIYLIIALIFIILAFLVIEGLKQITYFCFKHEVSMKSHNYEFPELITLLTLSISILLLVQPTK